MARAKTAWVPWKPENVQDESRFEGNFLQAGEGENEAGESAVFPVTTGDTTGVLANYADWLSIGPAD